MKKLFVNISIVILLTGIITISNAVKAQEPPHPPSSGHGQSGNQNPTNGGAPVGEGTVILSLLAGIYILKGKVLNRENKSDSE
jgi:hypothetical protein